jgi:hypothetical protein
MVVCSVTLLNKTNKNLYLITMKKEVYLGIKQSKMRIKVYLGICLNQINQIYLEGQVFFLDHYLNQKLHYLDKPLMYFKNKKQGKLETNRKMRIKIVKMNYIKQKKMNTQFLH